MLALIPAQLPPLPLILEDIGSPSPLELARSLGVSERTAYRWIRDAEAPRPAALALFFVTRWGVSSRDVEALRRVDDWRALAQARERENAALRAEIARLQAIGDFGAANDPSTIAGPAVRPAPAWPAPPRAPMTDLALARIVWS